VEDNLQTIIGVILSVFILFIFPVYMAYEKKDDVSYSLAMRYTQELVDEVRSKGYLTKSMYEEFERKLKITGNSYDIKLTHEYNRYDPITNYYTLENKKYVLVQTSTQESRKKYEQELIDDAIRGGGLTENSSKESIESYLKLRYEQENIYKVENTYRLSQEVNTEEHIKSVLYNEKKLKRNSQSDVVYCSDAKEEDGCEYAYTMNVDDTFNVIIKNTNTTLATVIYNMVTAHLLDDNTRIYVNYGGDILANKWQDNIDYAKMKHDNLSLSKFEETVIFSSEKRFSEDSSNQVTISKRFTDEYTLDFDVLPSDVTELRKKGDLDITDFSGYNFAMGVDRYAASQNLSYLSVSVGINGISLINTRINHPISENKIDLPEYATIVGGKQIIQNRRIDELSEITITDGGQGRLIIEYTLKKDGTSLAVEKQIVDDEYLFRGITWTSKNLEVGDYSVYKKGGMEFVLEAGTTSFRVTAGESIIDHTTLLSYPTEIKDYTNVRIEFVNKDENTNMYIANLYLDGTKVEESIPMTKIPELNIIGKAKMNSDIFSFNGNMKNVKIYSK